MPLQVNKRKFQPHSVEVHYCFWMCRSGLWLNGTSSGHSSRTLLRFSQQFQRATNAALPHFARLQMNARPVRPRQRHLSTASNITSSDLHLSRPTVRTEECNSSLHPEKDGNAWRSQDA